MGREDQLSSEAAWHTARRAEEGNEASRGLHEPSPRHSHQRSQLRLS